MTVTGHPSSESVSTGKKEILLAKLRTRWAETVELRELTWIVTYQCHLACRYCYVDTERARRASDSVLNVAQVANILVQARALGAHRFTLRGGEPFLRNDLTEILQIADVLGMTSDLITKIALSTRQISALARLKQLSLGISLDTVDPELGDAMLARRGQTKALMWTVQRLAGSGIVLTVEATVTRSSYDGLDALTKFCEAVGVARLHLRQVAPHKIRPVDALILTAKQAKGLLERSRNYGNLGIVTTPAFTTAPSCGEGVDSLTFLPDGKVTKCTASLSRHPAMCYGDLTRQSVAEVMTSPTLAHLIAQVLRSGPYLSPENSPETGRLPCSQLVALRYGEPLPRLIT